MDVASIRVTAYFKHKTKYRMRAIEVNANQVSCHFSELVRRSIFVFPTDYFNERSYGSNP